MFGMIAIAQVAMVVFMRWLVVRFMLRRMQRGGAGPAIVGIIGTVVIYGMIKAMEFQGFRLWLGSGWLPHFLCFAVPGVVLAVLLMPSRLQRHQ